jgi:hypothetical protein
MTRLLEISCMFRHMWRARDNPAILQLLFSQPVIPRIVYDTLILLIALEMDELKSTEETCQTDFNCGVNNPLLMIDKHAVPYICRRGSARTTNTKQMGRPRCIDVRRRREHVEDTRRAPTIGPVPCRDGLLARNCWEILRHFFLPAMDADRLELTATRNPLEDIELSPEESDTHLSPPEPEPAPGLHGNPVQCASLQTLSLLPHRSPHTFRV